MCASISRPSPTWSATVSTSTSMKGLNCTKRTMRARWEPATSICTPAGVWRIPLISAMVPVAYRSCSVVSSTCGSRCATSRICLSFSIAAVIAAIDVRRPTDSGTISLGNTTSSRNGTRGIRRSSTASAICLDLCSSVAHGRPPGPGRGNPAFERARSDQPRDLVFVENFFLQQGGGQRIELGTIRSQDALRRLVALVEEPGHFLVDDRGRPLADVRGAGQLTPQEDRLRRVVKGEEAHLLAHPPAHDHVASQFGRRLQVVLGAGRTRAEG